MAAQPRIQMTYNVRWVPDERELGEQLAGMPGIKTYLVGIGEEVAQEARLNLAAQGSGVPPATKGWKSYPKYGGVPFSARATAVAKEVEVKDASPVIVAKFAGAVGKHKIGKTVVALVVADHPYSRMWERGLMSLPTTNFLRKARVTIANSYAGIRNRRGGSAA